MSRKERDFKNPNNNGTNNPRGMISFSKPKNFKATAKRLISYIFSFENLFIPFIVLIIVYTILNISSNILLENLIESLGSFNIETSKWTLIPNENDFIKWLIIWAAFIVIYIVLRYISELMSAKLSTSITRDLRSKTFGRVVKLPISYFDTHPFGDTMSRMINDVDNVSSCVSSTISSLISGILTIIGCLGIMLYYSPLLTCVAIIVLFLTLISTILISKFMTPLHKAQTKLLGQLTAEAEEMISGSKTVIAYNRQEIAKEEFAIKSNKMSIIGTKAQIIGGSMGPVMNFVGNFGYFLVTLFGAIFFINGIGGSIIGEALSISVIVMFLGTVKQFNRPINEIAQLYSQLISAFAAAERIFEVLDEKEEDFTGKVEFDGSMIKGVIDFNHIGFGYVPEKPVLKDFNVDVRSGHKIALVGATGSGKTTIVNLLLRFYDINSGKITIDGVDIADISKKDLRNCISIVLQDPVLFNDSIENNIRYGRDNATDEEIDKALEFANCSNFVDTLQNGKKTILNEGASNISQGQRQLLTIARAVIADPKILILDEATSSVDTRTEKKIQDAMIKLMENRTSIIIAHRLSTIQDADLIIVLADGHIVEMGNHQELVEIDGVYNKLYQTQFAGNEI